MSAPHEAGAAPHARGVSLLLALNDELLAHVLSFLNPYERRGPRGACKRLRGAADDLVRSLAAGDGRNAGAAGAAEALRHLSAGAARWKRIEALELNLIEGGDEGAHAVDMACVLLTRAAR